MVRENRWDRLEFARTGCGSVAFAAGLLLASRAQAQDSAAPTAPVVTPAPADTPTPAGTPAPAPQVERKIEEYVANAYVNDTETRSRAIAYDRRAFADRVQQVLGNFIDINGYFRAGYGRSAQGGALAAFGAPGAGAKYRLGNEAENYGELIFGKSVYLPGAFRLNEDLRPDGTPTGPVARVQIRLSMVSPYATLGDGSATTFGVPEAWASIGNVIPGLPDAKFWAGRRFYRRHDIHINDFYFWDMSGGGGGIEDVHIGVAKLALAWIGFGTTSGLGNVPQPDPLNSAGFTKSSFDLRSYDLPLLAGKAEFGVTVSTQRSGLDQTGRKGPSTTGVALNFVHTASGFISEEGTNKLSIQYGTGPAKSFTSNFETISLPEGTFIRAEERAAYRFRVTEHFASNFGEHFSLAPALVFQITDQADGTGRQYWYSAGIRPTAHFNRYLSLAAEGGLDWVHDTGADTSAPLGKVTLAAQIGVGNRFDSRPVIRLFGTAAFWGEDFKGRVGGPDYAQDQQGFNAGAQMEAWW
jgi:maltoporin